MRSCIYYEINENIKRLKWIKIEENCEFNLCRECAGYMQGMCREYLVTSNAWQVTKKKTICQELNTILLSDFKRYISGYKNLDDERYLFRLPNSFLNTSWVLLLKSLKICLLGNSFSNLAGVFISFIME